MMPPVFTILKSDPSVFAIVGTRIYRHADAPQGVLKPYIVWSIITGMPDLQLSGAPLSDMDTVQIDCLSQTDSGVEDLAYAIRNALDNARIANRITLNGRDNETRLYRISIDADIIRSRS